jgi:hypothetical protein
MKNNWKIVFGASIFIGGILSIFASSSPDGLEKVAEMQGFLTQGEQLFVAIIPDYLMPGIWNEKLAVSLAGIVGTSVVFITIAFLGKYLYRAESQEER